MTVSTIRSAEVGDLDEMLVLAKVHRRQYETYQPIFWRTASDATARQREYFVSLIADEAIMTFVAICDNTLVGFVIGRLVPAPPVYNPGGPTCSIDDFTVDHPASWATVGVDLLRAMQKEAFSRGAAQLVVVCGHLDEPKRAALEGCALTIASEWWVAPLSESVLKF